MFLLLVATGRGLALDIHAWLSKRRAAGKPGAVVVEYPKSFFPVILVVFLLRSFLVEPFKIPSRSMLPTLLAVTYTTVNNSQTGIRLPTIST